MGAAAAVGLAVGAAGGYLSRGGPAPVATGTATATAPSAGVLRVGAPAMITGGMAAEGRDMINGTTLAAEEINAAGGIFGKKLEVIPADLGSLDPETIVPALEKLCGLEKPDIIINGWGIHPPGWGVITKYGIPTLTGDIVRAFPEFVKNNKPNSWCIYDLANDVYYAPELYKNIKRFAEESDWKPKRKRMYLLHTTYELEVDVTNDLKNLAEKDGWEVQRELISAGTLEWGGVIQKVKAWEPDYIGLYDGFPTDTAQFTKQFVASPINALLYIQYSATVPLYLEVTREFANGVLVCSLPVILPTPWGLAFKERFKQRFGYEGGMCTPGMAYEGLYLYKMAAERAGTLEPHAVMEELGKGEYYGQHILSGVYTWDYPEGREGHYPICDDDHIPVGLLQIQNQKHELINTKYRTSEFQLPPWFR